MTFFTLKLYDWLEQTLIETRKPHVDGLKKRRNEAQNACRTAPGQGRLSSTQTMSGQGRPSTACTSCIEGPYVDVEIVTIERETRSVYGD